MVWELFKDGRFIKMVKYPDLKSSFRIAKTTQIPSFKTRNPNIYWPFYSEYSLDS